MNTATLYAPHHSHGTVTGVVTPVVHLDSLLGEFVRTGIPVSFYDFKDRNGDPVSMWAQSDNFGNVKLIAEYV